MSEALGSFLKRPRRRKARRHKNTERRRQQLRVSQQGTRERDALGLDLYRVPANAARLIEGLLSKGYLRDDVVLSHEAIERALAAAVNELICQR
jgi:hypothetical protein